MAKRERLLRVAKDVVQSLEHRQELYVDILDEANTIQVAIEYLKNVAGEFYRAKVDEYLVDIFPDIENEEKEAPKV